MRVKIDGEVWRVTNYQDAGNGSGSTIKVKRDGAEGGPTASHVVPETRGKFHANGHDFDFTYGIGWTQ